MTLLQAPPPSVPVIECRLPEDADDRLFTLVDRGGNAEPRWVLILRARPLGQRAIDLPLPAARVTRAAGRVTVSSRSANGGLAVEIEATAADSTLDVFVNVELEVNVWRDLSPDVERMNTAGARHDAQCVILSDRAQMP